MALSSWPPAYLTPVSDVDIARGDGEFAAQFAEAFGSIGKDGIAGKAGEKLRLRDWQKELLLRLYARDENDGLVAQTALIGMPRKNGKSALSSAAIALYSLIAEGISGGEIIVAAAEKEQARIVFGEARRMVESSELADMVTIYKDSLFVPETNSVMRVVSAEAYSKEGLNPSRIIVDEIHAHKDRTLFDVLSLSQGNRGKISQLVAITTAGVKSDMTGKDSIAYTLYQYGKKVASGEIDDPSFFMAWWEAPENMDHKNPEAWQIANPGFEDIVSKQDFESAVRRTPEAEFRTKRLNQWVSSAEAWLPAGAWAACEDEFVITSDDNIVLAVDGSFSGDSTVIVAAVIPDTDDEPVKVSLVKAWEKDLDNDGDDWRVDIADVEATIVEFVTKHPNVKEIVFDPFRWARTMQVLEDQGFPVVEFPQSPSRMIKACAKFFDAVQEHNLIHDGNPTLARHLDNAVLKMTPAGPHIKKDARNSPRKIDAAVSSIMAVDRALSGRMVEVVPQFFF
jgi:phage terminase large subunit-like protein